MQEAFKIIEPSGKTYHLYEDGRVKGFESGAIVVNRIPMLLRKAQVSAPGLGSFPKLGCFELGDVVPEEIAHDAAHYLSLGLDCNVSIMEYRDQASYLFSALKKVGWTISPPEPGLRN